MTLHAISSFRFVATTLVLVAMVTTARPVGAQLRSDARRGFAIAIAPSDAPRWSATQTQQPPRRRSKSGGVALQFLAASAGAIGGGLGTFLLLRDVGKQRVEGDAGYTRAGNVGYLVGSVAGETMGAHVVGTSMGGKSPLWATTIGALVGTAPLLALGIDEPYLPLFGLALGWLPQGALATGGFTMGESHNAVERPGSSTR